MLEKRLSTPCLRGIDTPLAEELAPVGGNSTASSTYPRCGPPTPQASSQLQRERSRVLGERTLQNYLRRRGTSSLKCSSNQPGRNPTGSAAAPSLYHPSTSPQSPASRIHTPCALEQTLQQKFQPPKYPAPSLALPCRIVRICSQARPARLHPSLRIDSQSASVDNSLNSRQPPNRANTLHGTVLWPLLPHLK